MTTAAPQSQSASAFEPLVLLQMVCDIAETGGGVSPERISTRAWDQARSLSETFPDAPSARRICEHLDLSWEKLRELAFLPSAAQRIALGKALNERQGSWLTPEYSDYVLALVARRVGVRTLSPSAYRVERARMLAADRRSVHGGGLRLPTEDQIAAVAGSWDRALGHAGLSPRPARGHQPPRQRPLSIVEALERCYEHYETEPTSVELHAFAKANGIPLSRDRTRTWASYITEWKDGRRAAGLPVPDGPPPRHLRWDYTQNIGAGRPGEQRRRRDQPRDDLIDWLVRYLDQLRPRQHSTERGYNDWAAGQTGAPSSSAFDNHGGWAALRSDAQAELRRRRLTGAAEPRTPPINLSDMPGQRRRRPPTSLGGRQAKATLGDFVAAGRLRGDETLIGSYKGRSWRAAFDSQTGVVRVQGEGEFASLTGAAVHCQGGGAVSGFAFWGVERDGRVIKLAKLWNPN
ncbi:hypothetical protein [Conexibacter sp. DBS9H8]|uniref:hypothetical protein n=1 Tax=Conexibacter sp. DBS9H8 TaxID=2937801 RepID=UPI00201061C2|nr:hypothetical protein [Conexibacter sp. DBS9H8]